jgi:hypothetical protein
VRSLALARRREWRLWVDLSRPIVRTKVRYRRFSVTQPLQLEGLFLPDTVEQVGFEVMAVGRVGGLGRAGDRPVGSGRCDRRRQWDQLGELAEVLGGGGEVELIAGAVWPA